MFKYVYRCAPGTIYYGNGKCDYGSSNNNGGSGGGGYNKCLLNKINFNQKEWKEFQINSNL